MSKLCFVYGTLKRGFSNHSVMQRAGGTYLGPAVLPNHRMISLGGFPGVLPTNQPGQPVHGEIYSVMDWSPLDRLEGYRMEDPAGSMYIRKSATVYTPDQGPVLVQTYIWNGPPYEHTTIKGGVWV